MAASRLFLSENIMFYQLDYIPCIYPPYDLRYVRDLPMIKQVSLLGEREGSEKGGRRGFSKIRVSRASEAIDGPDCLSKGEMVPCRTQALTSRVRHTLNYFFH